MTAEAPFRVHVVEVGPLVVNAYLVEHARSGQAAVIDPGDEGEALLLEIARRNLSVDLILLTHGHFDHVGGVKVLRERTGAKVHVHPMDAERMRIASRQGMIFGLRVPDPPPPDVLVEDGAVVPFAGSEFRVLHTPGHTPGCVTYLLGGTAFVGDLIFSGSIGRTDLPGGRHEELLRSVREKIFTLPDATVLFPGHGPPTTVGEERRTNPFFAGGWNP